MYTQHLTCATSPIFNSSNALNPLNISMVRVLCEHVSRAASRAASMAVVS